MIIGECFLALNVALATSMLRLSRIGIKSHNNPFGFTLHWESTVENCTLCKGLPWSRGVEQKEGGAGEDWSEGRYTHRGEAYSGTLDMPRRYKLRRKLLGKAQVEGHCMDRESESQRGTA